MPDVGPETMLTPISGIESAADVTTPLTVTLFCAVAAIALHMSAAQSAILSSLFFIMNVFISCVQYANICIIY